MERDRGHSQPSNDGSITSLANKETPPCQHGDDDSQGSKRIRCSWIDLPEEIWHHIHSLVPMREAAQASCVSHAFLHLWRCRTNLTFTKETICSKQNWFDVGEFNNSINHILVNHPTTVGAKTLILKLHGPYDGNYYNCLDCWLKIAVTPKIEELTLVLRQWTEEIKYNFPCSLLSGVSGNTLRYLRLDRCVLRPTSGLAMKSLTMLHLCKVRITGDELGCLLSHCFALEQLKLRYCDDIICLAIPSLLQRFSFLKVLKCANLQMIENKAPNLSSFSFSSNSNQIQLALGESLTVKTLKLRHKGAIGYAIDKLPSYVPNLETLTIHTFSETVNVPIVCIKFLHLKFLTIYTCGWDIFHEYDYLSLVSFLDASPSLVTFDLHVCDVQVSKKYKYEWLQGYPSSLRQMPERQHGNLKNVKITGFCLQKSIIELTLHILETAPSLKCLTLDTFPVYYQHCGNTLDKKCPRFNRSFIMEARAIILAIRTHIERKVPSTVKLNVPEP
ncbi:uncharacterized protein [Lolium perenne]|uniref:uncharacterized protein n=1 Tax=Lolium perenne TaxID=4522 RepID=UPI0021F5A3B9|nr:uncharacterized protein LOC127298291 [Lolium perenne]